MRKPAERIVHARLDPETRRLFERLQRRTGLSDSELVRRAVQALARGQVEGGRPRVVGVGKFESGVGDLSTNPEHFEGFGRS